MDEKTLCRVCLEDGATLPIFNTEEKDSIYFKLTSCLNEKIEDVVGYPRCICNSCYKILETISNFINKYKESSKILENKLLGLIKNENIDHNDTYDLTFDDSDEDIKVKTEPEVDLDNTIDCGEFLNNWAKPLQLSIKKIKTEVKIENCWKEEEKPKKTKVKYKKKKKVITKKLNKTNKIATSILEGEFVWSSDEWCLNKTNIDSKDTQKTKVSNKTCTEKVINKRTKLKIPKLPKPPPPKLCDICGGVFKNNDRLSAHKRIKHNRNPVKCSKCKVICASEYYLNRHMRRKHDKDKDFICSKCGARFAFKGELSNHNKRVHNKHLFPKRTWQCSMCDKTYKCQKSVTIHERAVHTGQRPATCTVCDQSFYHEDYLKEHMRLHTGETPFKCPICGRGYAQRGNMKSHLRNHRVADIPPDILCTLRPSYMKSLKDFR